MQERWLESRPGVGTVVAASPQARTADRDNLLGDELEQLAVSAMRLGLSQKDVEAALAAHWKTLADKKGRSE